ncbi:hypothetical protein [Natrinema marinum]|uniref:hypothetical protein n=1 Tax=Natrinema marinum TaxID=2961598 RepID=UPI0020C8CCB5|nr:hypothetical protein [Natrinema marinum]
MVSEDIRRRRLLQVCGATLAAGAAGCLGGGSGNGSGSGSGNGGAGTSDTPAYAQWVTTVEDEVSLSYLDLAALNELESDDEDSSGGSSGLEDIEDPMLRLPLAGAFSAMFAAGFGLSGSGLSGLISDQQTSDTSFETAIDALLMTNETIVLSGDVVTDEIDGELTTVAENSFAEIEFEHTSDIGEYAVYEPAGDQGTTTTLAVAGEAIVQGSSLTAVERAIETKQGERSRAVDEHETFRRLLATGGHGEMVFGGYSPDGFDGAGSGGSSSGSSSGFQIDAFTALNGAVSSLSFSGSSDVTGETALSFDELDETARSDLESALGKTSSDVSVNFDGTFVSASATFSDDALQNA